MSFKSARLLVEAIHSEMDNLRKSAMAIDGGTPDQKADIFEVMGTLRGLFDELAAKADRPSIDDVTKLSPGEYVATMKPLVGNYHRQLMVADNLTACLCEDLQATGCVLILIGDGKSIIRTAVDPNRPEAQLVVEALLISLDGWTKQILTDGVTEAEKQLGVEVPESDLEPKP